MSATYVLFHANCPDGFGAAYAAWKHFGDQAEYIPVKHGNPPPEMQPQSDVYIIDYAYARPILLELQSQHRKLQVLDHHKTAQEDLQGLDCAIFNMYKSGAVLSWEYFHPDTEVPLLLQYVQDQDLWNWALPDSQAICTALSLYEMKFDVWDQLNVDTLLQEGRVALRYKQQMVERLCQRVDWIEIDGHKVPAVNTPVLASEVGNELCLRNPNAPFAACYSDLDGQRKWSLRSIGESDTSAVSKKFGGGGHRNASGFATKQPFDGIKSE